MYSYISSLKNNNYRAIKCFLNYWLQLAAFLLAFIFLIGAWLGFWVVQKFVLDEDGSIDTSTSLFVTWSIRILAALLILQVFSLSLLLSVLEIISLFVLFFFKTSKVYTLIGFKNLDHLTLRHVEKINFRDIWYLMWPQGQVDLEYFRYY